MSVSDDWNQIEQDSGVDGTWLAKIAGGLDAGEDAIRDCPGIDPMADVALEEITEARVALQSIAAALVRLRAAHQTQQRHIEDSAKMWHRSMHSGAYEVCTSPACVHARAAVSGTENTETEKR